MTFLVCVYPDLPSWRLGWFQSAKRVTVKLSTIFRQLEYPFQLLDFIRRRAHREVMRQTVLNESLTMLVANVLHIDISYARCKISHGPRPVLDGRGSNLSLRAHETILKEVRQSHGDGFSNFHPQFQFLFVSLTFCPAFVGMPQ
jgi:hypothetical protein